MIRKAIEILKNKGVIAYPTEAVYGLGCDPFSKSAVEKILKLKKRDVSKGLILIAANWEQIKELTNPVPKEKLEQAFKTWPGPVTWVFPASDKAPKWITGKHDSIALRITDHPVAKKLCEEFGGPIVSTSANLESHSPAKTEMAVKEYFPKDVVCFVLGEVGNLSRPTSVYDVLTGKIIR